MSSGGIYQKKLTTTIIQKLSFGNLREIFLFIFLNIITFPTYAQNLSGISTSNYAGTNGLYQNPSIIADSRFKLFINLFTADLHAGNTFIRYNSSHSILGLGIKKLSGERIGNQEDYLEGRLNGDRKLFYLGADIRGPSIMFHINEYNSVAITTRMRSSFQMNNMSEAIARLLVHESVDPELQDLDFFRKTFDFNVNTFGEIGLSYATIITDKGNSFLKAGFSIKKLAGLYSAHFINNEVSYHLRNKSETPQEQSIEISSIKAQIGYVENHNSKALMNATNWITGRGMSGSGLGLDLGFTYEFRPDSRKYSYLMDGRELQDDSKNKYKYRIGISMIDLGSIKYKGQNVKNYQVFQQNKELYMSDFKGLRNNHEVSEYLIEVLDPELSGNSFTSRLPTALNFNLDYKIHDKIYFNALWIPELNPKKKTGIQHNSLFAVAPRVEMKYFEFSLPISIANKYHDLTVGALLRLGTLFIGSDNLGGLLNLGKPQGANIYTGLSLPIHAKGKLKDRDMDGISDKKDHCPDISGTLSLQGCPDSDMDGIPDHLDVCPNLFGGKVENGCPKTESMDHYKVIILSKEEKKIINKTVENLAFEIGKTEIKESSFQSLDKLVLLLKRRPGYKLLIEGHSDNTGDKSKNYSISLTRAETVKKYLLSKGLQEENLLTEAYGSLRPVSENDTEEGRSKNRRVEFKFIQD